MANRKSNRLLWVLVGAMVVFAIPVLLKTTSSTEEAFTPMTQVPEAYNPTADSALETLQGFQAEVEQANQGLAQMHASQEELLTQLKDEKITLSELQQAYQTSQDKQAALETKLQHALDSLSQLQTHSALATPQALPSTVNGIPTGLGYDDISPVSAPSLAPVMLSPQQGRWLPIESQESEDEGNPIGGLFQKASNTFDKKLQTVSDEKSHPPVKPVMTIAKTAVGLDAVAWTALIGRIPNDGQVTDPYPVKLIIGKEVLMANGHRLANVEAAFAQGIAKGDRNLRCVSVDIKTLSFIFSDGHIVTHDTQGQGQGQEKNQRLGWVSDAYGWPCVSGKLISNASSVQFKKSLAHMLGATGEAVAQAQETVRTGALGDTQRFVSGDQAKFIVGEVARASADDVQAWFAQQADTQFDAVIVPPNTQVAIHFEETLVIDYDTNSRRVHYAQQGLSDYQLD